MNRPVQPPVHATVPADDLLRQSLRAYAAAVTAGGPVPVSLVWFRAERRRRALALRRAQRPVRIMQLIGLLCALLAAVWGGARFIHLAGLGTLLPRPNLAEPFLLLLIAGSGLVLLGCCGMLLASRQ